MHLLAELLRDDAAHHVEKTFAGLFEDEGVFGVGPAELEAGGEGGDPDFANGSVWRNDEFGFFGLIEDDFELAAFAFDVKIMLVAKCEQATLEIVESGVGFALEVFFVKHEVRVSELRFDGFGDFFGADDAGDAFYDFAVARDEDAGGIAEEAAEFVGCGVVADYDGIVHLGFRAVDIEAFFVDPGCDYLGAFFIHGDAKNGEALGGVFLLNFDEPGNFDLAGLAPSGPKVDQNYFAFVLGEGKIFAVEISQGDFGSRLAGSVGLTGGTARGNADYAFARLAGGAVGEIGGGENSNHRDDYE